MKPIDRILMVMLIAGLCGWAWRCEQRADRVERLLYNLDPQMAEASQRAADIRRAAGLAHIEGRIDDAELRRREYQARDILARALERVGR